MRRRTALAGGLFALAGFVYSDWPVAVRFAYPPLNYGFWAVLTVSVPLSLLWCAMGIRGRSGRIVGVLGAVAWLLPALLVSSFALLEAPHTTSGRDLSFDLLSEVQVGGIHYRLY